jgi:hypothetical protein
MMFFLTDFTFFLFFTEDSSVRSHYSFEFFVEFSYFEISCITFFNFLRLLFKVTSWNESNDIIWNSTVSFVNNWNLPLWMVPTANDLHTDPRLAVVCLWPKDNLRPSSILKLQRQFSPTFTNSDGCLIFLSQDKSEM